MRIQYNISLLCLLLALTLGCERKFIRTPNLYLDAKTDPFADVPLHFQSNTLDLLYATDRARQDDKKGDSHYGYERSRSLAFGSCIVELGKDVPWESLVHESQTNNRTTQLIPRVRLITEMGRFPESPLPLVSIDGENTVAPESIMQRDKTLATLNQEIDRRLSLTPRKEAFVYIHGINNDFEDVAMRMAELWHFFGRQGVPIFYTWPAGHPGMLRNYTYDRESGQFTNFHLKNFLLALAAHPDLEKINIIAHSRGTDIALTALKENILIARAQGHDPKTFLKINHLVLASADISHDVFSQRFGAERLLDGIEKVTFYVNQKDRAILAAEWLFADEGRIGQVRPEEMSTQEREGLKLHKDRVHIVDSRIKTNFLGHSYFLDNPATLSDLILMLRYNHPPGAAHGRPLTELIPSYYILNDHYPKKQAPFPEKLRTSTKEQNPTPHAMPTDPKETLTQTLK